MRRKTGRSRPQGAGGLGAETLWCGGPRRLSAATRTGVAMRGGPMSDGICESGVHEQQIAPGEGKAAVRHASCNRRITDEMRWLFP